MQVGRVQSERFLCERVGYVSPEELRIVRVGHATSVSILRLYSCMWNERLMGPGCSSVLSVDLRAVGS